MSVKDFTDDEVQNSIIESTFSINPANPSQLLITEDTDLVGHARHIEWMVRAIVKFDGHPYIPYHESQDQGVVRISTTDLGRILLLALKNKMAQKLILSFPFHRFNPYLELFVRHVQQGNLEVLANEHIWPHMFEPDVYVTPDPENIAELNRFVQSVRAEAQHKSFTLLINNFDRLSRKNSRGLVNLIEGVFQRHSRSLVIRLDLSYGKEQYYRVHERSIPYLQEKYFEAKNDREHFFKNTRSNPLFEHMLAYAWKLEYGPCKGFHYHMLFFFDGSKVRQDVVIARLIGEYWSKTITDGRGLYFNCNALKGQYQFPGIGMIGHADTALKEALINKVAPYLTKVEYYCHMIAPDKGRTFGRSELLEPKTETRGRPRNQDS